VVPSAVQEWHGGSSLCGWWPTSSGTHHFPGSVSFAVGAALRLYACGLFLWDLIMQNYELFFF
jgi:hypothetical protein